MILLLVGYFIGWAAVPLLRLPTLTRQSVAEWVAVTSLASAATVVLWASPVLLPAVRPFLWRLL